MKQHIGLILFLVLLVSCAPTTPASQSTTDVKSPSATRVIDNSSTAAITLVRSGGLAGKTESITIYQNGKLIKADGSELSLTTDQVSNTLGEIKTMGFYEMNNNYGMLSNCKDCFTYEITINADGQTKTVKAVEGDKGTPPEFWQIVEKIQNLATSAQ